MNLEDLRAPFPREAIHWRAQTVTKKGDKALALAYLDARDVRQRLNDVCGPENWACEHYDCGGGKLGCRIGINISGSQIVSGGQDGEIPVRIEPCWVWKSDGAGETQVEAEKGAFSSALKRAAVAWGVGEYLYDMESVWVPCKTWTDNKGKLRFDSFTDDPWRHVRSAPKVEPQPAQAAPSPVEKMLREIERRTGKVGALEQLKGIPEWNADYAELSPEDQGKINTAFNDALPKKAA